MAILAHQYTKATEVSLWFNGAPVYDLEGFTANVTHNNVEVLQAGNNNVGYKTNTVQGEGTITVKKAVSRSAEFLEATQSGKTVLFDIVFRVEDKEGLGVEEQTIKNCVLGSYQLANVGSLGDGIIMEEITFTFQPQYATFKGSISVSALGN